MYDKNNTFVKIFLPLLTAYNYQHIFLKLIKFIYFYDNI